MSELTATQIPKPSDEQAFERCNEVLWRCILKNDRVQCYGRRGQRQHGVDIVGYRNDSVDRIVGIQCKLKGAGKILEENEVRKEVTKALTFKPPLSEYIIVTTAPDDAKLVTLAIELSGSASEGREKNLKVSIFGWGSLEREINRCPEARNAFDPSYTPQGDRIEQRMENLPGEVRVGMDSKLDAILAAVAPHPVNPIVSNATVQTALDRQINDYVEIIATEPATALDLFQKLHQRLDDVPDRIKFKVAANIAVCQLELGDEETAAQGLIAAFDFAPDDPKAIANKAFGLFLKEDWPRLRAFAERRLAEHPNNPTLAACYIHSLIIDETINDPLVLVPKAVHGTPEVAEAHVRWLMDRGDHGAWWDVAIAAHDAHAENDALKELCACALLDRVIGGGRSVHRLMLTPAEDADIQAATGIYETRWPEIRDRSRHVRGEPIHVPINLMTAYRLRCQHKKAIEVGTEAMARFRGESDTVKKHLVVALAEHGETDRALNLISELGINRQTVAVRYNIAIANEDWEAVLDLADKHLDIFSETERNLVRAIRIVAKVELATVEDRRSILEEQKGTFEGDTRALANLAQSARVHGFDDVASAYFAGARAALERGDDAFVSRFSVAREAMACGEPGTAADVLIDHVPLGRDSVELQLLAQALVNDYPIRERAIRFFDDLALEIRSLPSFQQLEGVLHINRGIPRDAIGPFSFVYEHQPTIGNLLRLINAHLMNDDKSAIATLLQRDGVDALPGSPSDRMDLYHVLLDFGDGARVLDLGYQALIEGLEHDAVVRKFLELIPKFTQNRPYDFDGVVVPGVWVRLTQSHGETYEVLLSEAADRPWGAKADPSNVFIANALGRGAGDEFERVNAATGAIETWTIAEVKPRWLQAFHHLSGTFNQRFPDAQGFASIEMAEGDIGPVWDLERRRDEKERARADLYLVKNLPIALVAGDKPGGSIAFAQYLALMGQDVRVCLGTEEERTGSFALIEEHGRAGAILDALTAWHASMLGIFPVLGERLGALSVPASELHRLRAMVDYHEALAGEETMSVSCQGGQYIHEVVTAQEQVERLALIKSRIESIEKACNEEPTVIPDYLSERGEKLIRIPVRDAFAPAVIAGRDRLLLSEDLMMRQLASSAYGTRSVWLQAVLMNAVQAGAMTHDAYVDALVHLAVCRHGPVAVNARDLLSAFVGDTSDELVRLQALCTYIGHENSDPVSHITLAAGFINRIYTNASAHDLRVRAATNLIFEALLSGNRGGDWARWAATFFGRLAEIPKAGLLDWCREHSLPIDEINHVLRQAGDGGRTHE